MESIGLQKSESQEPGARKTEDSALFHLLQITVGGIAFGMKSTG